MATTPTPPRVSTTDGTRTRRTDRTAAGTGNRPDRPPRSRVGALWIGICTAALLLVALIVFMLQNTQTVLVSFLGMQGTVPLAVALLIAGVAVGIIALVVGSVRISQLRRRLRRREGE